MQEIPAHLAGVLGDRYRLIREIGAGGMATVYLADDVRHGRQVAVKVLRPDIAEVVGADRFLREIEIAASLTHPNILALYDSGERNGVLFYVMPFIEGETLRERMEREGPLPIPDAIRLLRQIVDALDHAHRRGVIHRDIKPENVLLSGTHAFVADFGIARAVESVEDEARLTTLGVAVGTPHYMAPEQAIADPEADGRADLFAAGAVAYEMLTGRPPFDGATTRGVLTAVLTETPEPPQARRDAIPEQLGALVVQCLQKDAADRPQSARAILSRLDSLATPTAGIQAVGSRHAGRRVFWLAAPLLFLLVLAALGVSRWNRAQAERDWARTEAIPEVTRLVADHRLAEAAQLALRTEEILGLDPALDRIWPLVLSPFRIHTDPPGATIQYRPYGSGQPWNELGASPYTTERFPLGAFEFQIQRDGFEPRTLVRSLTSTTMYTEIANTGYDYLEDPSYVIDLALTPVDSVTDGMIQIAGGIYGTTPVAGFGNVDPRPIPTYLIDRTEVSNAAYAEFVRSGGYDEPTHWVEPFVRNGRRLSFDDGIALLGDSTGRPGPAGWALSRPPRGRETHPVRGVSWYEAAAYCRWRGARLPTLHHWARAALPSSDSWTPFFTDLAAASHFDGTGPLPVGASDAAGISGALDLAGNVREWASTASGPNRYLLGGAWSDPTYFIHSPYFASPWQREPTDGFRCARYPEGEAPEHLSAPIELPVQDLDRRVPISDDVFEAQMAFYRYDSNTPLGAVVDSTGVTEWGGQWEWVTINTAYGDRMPLRIHLPVDAAPPFEPVIYFGGGNTILAREMEDILQPLDQLVLTGRALVEPVFDGTFVRNDGNSLTRLRGENAAELIANWVKDVGRAIDYLESRPDMDASRTAYAAQSLGSNLIPYLVPRERRIRAVVALSAGFARVSPQPVVDRIIGNLARVRVPLLMMGGRNDFFFPLEHQEAWFDAVGTPQELKFLRLYETGHWPLPFGEVLRETVDFLDRYAGPEPDSTARRSGV